MPEDSYHSDWAGTEQGECHRFFGRRFSEATDLFGMPQNCDGVFYYPEGESYFRKAEFCVVGTKGYLNWQLVRHRIKNLRAYGLAQHVRITRTKGRRKRYGMTKKGGLSEGRLKTKQHGIHTDITGVAVAIAIDRNAAIVPEAIAILGAEY